MAGFVLCNKREVSKRIINEARYAFYNKSFHLEEHIFVLGDFELYYFSKYQDKRNRIYKNNKGDLLCACGSLLFNGETGSDALELVYKELIKGKKLDELPISGNYVLLSFIGKEVLITRDLFGGEVCYTNEENTWFTTNFLSAIILNKKKELRKQELLEYILYGFVFGDLSLINHINLLNPNILYHISKKQKQDKQIIIPEIESNYNKCLDDNINVLLSEFSLYKKAFGNNVISALSGGFDSRLMLALQLKTDIVPNLYVYGKDSHPEVKTAKEITEKEKLNLLHVNKSNYERVSVSQFKEVMEKNLWGLDGFVNVGLIGDQSDLQERINRGKTNGILINGAGGEIYRDVWQWNFKKTTIKDLFMASYNTGELSYLGIDENEFFRNIEKKLVTKFKHFFSFDKYITRQQAEIIFPIYRSNFYYSNNTLDNYFSNSHLPFMSKPVTLQSFSIPAKNKIDGKFEMDLIKTLSPGLAAYKSSYGFNFINGKNNKERLVGFFYRNLQPSHKALLKRYSGRSKKSLFNTGNLKNIYLTEQYLSEILDLENLNYNKYLKNGIKIKNLTVLNRIYSLEYLSQKFDIIWEW